MKKVEIGIDQLQGIFLRQCCDELRIDDYSNDGVIECNIANLKNAIRIIEDAYRNREDLQGVVYGYGNNTVQLSYYQRSIGKRVFESNYIVISHLPAIIKMLKSVKVEKEKYILDKESLFGLSINNLAHLKHVMKRRKRVFTDDNGHKYIEV
jgi:hypothetical protein